MNTDARQYAPATQRNRKPILEVLLRLLPKQGNILELASGTGEHAVFFAPYFLPRLWIPSDPNSLSRNSIEAWRNYYQIKNIAPVLDINVCDPLWEIETEAMTITSIININMIHISPWTACLGLMVGAGRLLPQEGILYLYGPYKLAGQHISPSNMAFDHSLRSQNSDWGVRNLEDVVKVADEQGLQLIETVPMPANNLSIVFKRN
jgi:hypothetical protein